jgi:uncharacterized protein YndB with AHSA1/START domain
MSTPSIVHGSFTIDRTYAAPVPRVFAAWADIEMKARWFLGPPESWKLVQRELDFRVGGREVLRGEHASGRTSHFEARYHVIVPDQRLVYAYDMDVGDKHLSVSLATVELTATASGGTRMTFSEQAVFLDGEDGVRSRETGTAAHFERLAAALEDPREYFASRIFSAPRERVFEAFSDPVQLAKWWGPKGFTNSFQTFEFKPAGAWRFVMHGPDGTDYPIAKDFVEVVPPEKIAYQNLEPTHRFKMTMLFTDLGERTRVSWRMLFESVEEAVRVRQVVSDANEQNFDRLAAHLAARH